MTRCIFRKQQRQFKVTHCLAVVTLLVGAALYLAEQAELNLNPQTGHRLPLISRLHRP